MDASVAATEATEVLDAALDTSALEQPHVDVSSRRRRQRRRAVASRVEAMAAPAPRPAARHHWAESASKMLLARTAYSSFKHGLQKKERLNDIATGEFSSLMAASFTRVWTQRELREQERAERAEREEAERAERQARLEREARQRWEAARTAMIEDESISNVDKYVPDENGEYRFWSLEERREVLMAEAAAAKQRKNRQLPQL